MASAFSFSSFSFSRRSASAFSFSSFSFSRRSASAFSSSSFSFSRRSASAFSFSAFSFSRRSASASGVVDAEEFSAGVAVVAVGFSLFDEFVLVVVELFATIGVSSAAKAKLSWSYDSIAAIAENIAVADKTFNNVVFFILGILSFNLYIIRY